MKSMDYFLKFRRSHEDFTAKNEILRKKLEDSEAALVKLRESHDQKEKELLLSGE